LEDATAVVLEHLDDGNVYGVNKSGEIFIVKTSYTETNNKFYMAENLSMYIPEVKWTSQTSFAFSNNTIWVADGSEIWGFSDKGWKKKRDLGDNKIDSIFVYRNNLCVYINNDPFKPGRIKIVKLYGTG